MFSSAELVLVRKDLSAIWRRKGIRALLMILPVVLMVVIPLTYFVAISLLPDPKSAQLPETIRGMLPADSAQHGYRQFWMDAFTTLLCPVLYLAVPIVCSVASASCAFVGEKENGTLETVWLSPMSGRSIFNAKLIACSLISVIISLISFVLFSITVSVADIMLSAPYFFNLEWLATVLLLTPALSLFSVVFVSLVLPRVNSVGESLQTMGYLILPFIVLYLFQFTGILRISLLFLVVLCVALLVLAIILFNISSRNFQAEKLLTPSQEELS